MKSLFFVVFCLLLCVLGSGQALGGEPAHWMKGLPDDTSLCELAIPGTHNTAALYEPLDGTARCQSLTISEQLKIGVRFLDLRCRHVQDEFHLYHGIINQKLTFAACLVELEKFLTAHPSETIIVSINETSGAKENTRSFPDTFKESIKNKNWWLKEKLPKLGEARGKLILLRRFKSKIALGIPATNWRSNQLHQTKQLIIQDYFSPKNADEKWKAVENAFKVKNQAKLKLNFCSGYLKGKFGLPNILKISNPVNKKLGNYLPKVKHFDGSIVILDFVTPELANAILRLNATP